MRLSKKRTCEGCRAIIDAQGEVMRCSLGYDNKGEYIRTIGSHRIKPQEPCLKPMTISEFIEAMQTNKKS